MATKPAPQPGMIESTAACEKAGPGTAPGKAWYRNAPAVDGSGMLYMPVARIMKAVAEHTSSVSTYTANACTKPCCAGCCTSAAAAACGPVPCPASLE